MTARDEILVRVRSALAEAESPAVPVSRDYRARQQTRETTALFAERVADYRATVRRCRAHEVGTMLTELVPAEARLLVPEGFPWPAPPSVTVVPDDELTPAELDTVDAVVTSATVGIALTGTIVLTHGRGEGRRAVSLVPDLHVCVVRSDQVVADVSEAVAMLDPALPQTWISGPSATSDIELSRVEGVHGPRTLRVVLVD